MTWGRRPASASTATHPFPRKDVLLHDRGQQRCCIKRVLRLPGRVLTNSILEGLLRLPQSGLYASRGLFGCLYGTGRKLALSAGALSSAVNARTAAATPPLVSGHPRRPAAKVVLSLIHTLPLPAVPFPRKRYQLGEEIAAVPALE